MSQLSLPRSRWSPYFFIAPFLLGFLIFTLYPLISSILLSLHQTFGPRTRVFVGTRNYLFLLHDLQFWKAVRNTCVFAAGSLFIQLPCSLALAMLLDRPGIRGRIFFRLVFFSPSLLGLAFVAMISGLAFEKRTGLVDVIFHRAIGFNLDYAWLDEHVMPALILTALWVYCGFNMVYFLAALQNVSQELLDAARVDGAGPWHRFWHVTLPAIRPVGSFVVLLSLIGSFQLFELPYVLFYATGNPGGPNDQALTVVTYLYEQGFQYGDLGYASAIGWMLAIVLGIFALIEIRVSSDSEGA